MSTSTSKLLHFGLAASLVAVTACSSGNTSKPADTGSGSNPASGAAAQTPQKPDKLKIYLSDNLKPIPSGPSMSIPTIKYLAEKTNTDLDITYFPHGKYLEQLRLKFASGEFPDLHMDWGITTSQLVTNNLALPLNDLLKQHGPNLLKNIPQASWDAVSVNGKILGIPEPVQGTADRVIYVRKDWMDKLGLKQPKTPDEFLDMLRAFRDKNPDNIDKNTLIPFSGRSKFTWMHNIFGMWGVDPTGFTMQNGEMIPGFLHPDMKKVLAYMKTMYDEKLLDSEFNVLDGNTQIQKVSSGRVGAFNHIPGSVQSWQDRVKNIPGAEFIAIPTPRAPGYTDPVGGPKKTISKTYIIHKDSKNAAAAIRLMNWLVTEEGAIWANLGLEGDTWKKENGKIVYDPKKDADENKDGPRFSLIMAPFNEQVNNAKLMHDEKKIKTYNETLKVTNSEGFYVSTEAMPAPATLASNADLKFDGTLLQETMAQIVLGRKPISYFDEFIQTWRKQGGDAVIKEVTEWYNANKKK